MEREPMWYDERYYLKEENEYDREPIYEFRWQVRMLRMFDEIINSSLIDEYDSFIKKVSSLVSELSLKDNSLSTVLSTGILLSNGMFSINGKLIYNDKNFDTLSTKFGIDAVIGLGRCRHFSSFIDDVMQNLQIKSNIFPCNYLDMHSEVLLSSEANHMANIVYYNRIPYVFDTLNDNAFFSFVDEFIAVPIDRISSVCYHYKPYYEMVYSGKSLSEVKEQIESYRKSVGRSISYQEFLDIKRETDEKLEKDMDLIYDFVLDTDADLKRIEKEVEKIKKKK